MPLGRRGNETGGRVSARRPISFRQHGPVHDCHPSGTPLHSRGTRPAVASIARRTADMRSSRGDTKGPRNAFFDRGRWPRLSVIARRARTGFGKDYWYQMNRSNRHLKRMILYRRWSLCFVFLLIVFTGHVILVSAIATERVSASGAVAASEPGSDPDHVVQCAIDGSLVSTDRGRSGPTAINTVDAGPVDQATVAWSPIKPAVQIPPLTPSTRRALLQVFLI